MKKISLFITVLIISALIVSASVQGQVVIPANKAWTATKIMVNKGDQVEIQASGSATLDPSVSTDPDGLKIVSGPEAVLISGINRGALLVKIGKKGIPFQGGSNGKFMAGTTGALYFGLNDDKPKNNQGAYHINITINGQAAQIPAGKK